MFIESLEDRRFLSASVLDADAAANTGSKSSDGGQSNFPPGQFPAGNPAQAPGNSNSPGKSGK